MAIDALGGETALTSTLASLTGSARDRARPQAPEAIKNDQPADRPKPEKPETDPEIAQSADRQSVAEIASEAAEEARNDASAQPTHLSILYDREIDLFISRRVDRESGEVVRQFPYEDHLERMRTLTAQRGDDAEERVDLKV